MKWKIFIVVEHGSVLKCVVKELTVKLAEGREKIADHLSEGGVIPRRAAMPPKPQMELLLALLQTNNLYLHLV